ncbi:fatty acyl-CoA reductase wat-like [Temnothorax curvispinosus]|uniref:Fatty acyl-CoA reductase n=1 Tax=Temnothorax curvispinosus TaxID=300111 RepID=A0A6J1PKS3_9HYME|nr:fatty acyl-CoA reductase wat-like [Temnothorax curvispinosus]
MIDVAESLDEHTLNIFTAKCLDYVPNTYTFSKNLAESVIQEYSSSLPCAIVRPSMVYPSLKEPMPGWIDNVYGPIGLAIGGGKGIIRIGYCNKYTVEDTVPVDIVTKAILVVSWKLGLTNFTAGFTFVLNCTSQTPMTHQNVIKLCRPILTEVPVEGMVWTTSQTITDNFTLYYILTILLHILPAMLIDMILKFSGRRPILVRLQRKLYVVNRALGYYGCNEWKFSNVNSLTLMSSISPDDWNMFSFDYSNFNSKEYYK